MEEGPRGVRSLEDVMERSKPVEESQGHVALRASRGVDAAIPKSYREAVESPEAEQWREAIRVEYESLIQHGTWTLEPLPKGRKAVGCKWVFDLKRDKAGNVQRYKARLVAKGYSQVEGVDFQETFSPVARFTTMRVILTMAADQDLEVHQLDIKTAFLNGYLEEEIYMEQPEGYVLEGESTRGQGKSTRLVCKLQRSLYGLKQASRAWNERLRVELAKLEFDPAPMEPSLFLHRGGKGPYLLVYVDDILMVGRSVDMAPLKQELEKIFTVTGGEEASFFLSIGLERDREAGTFTLTQRRYGQDVLERFGMLDCRSTRTPLPSGFKFHQEPQGERVEIPPRDYQSAVGSLMYLVTGTRPDLAFAVGAASRYLTCPTKHHWEGIMHVMRYLKSTLDTGLVLGRKSGEAPGQLQLYAHSDADWGANDEERRSISGYTFTLGQGLVSWSSKRQSTPALSSTEAEYMALARATKEALWLQALVGHITGFTPGTVPIRVDNSSCIAMSKNPEFHDRTKHIDIQYHFLRAHVSTRRVEIQYCRTEEMVADILTKALPKAKHDWCVKAMGLVQTRLEESTRQKDGSTRKAAVVAEGTSPSSKGEIVGILGPHGAKDSDGVLAHREAGEPKVALRSKGQEARVKTKVVFCNPGVYAQGETGQRTGPNPNPLGPQASGVTGPHGPT